MVPALVAMIECLEIYATNTVVAVLQSVTKILGDALVTVQSENSEIYVTSHAIKYVQMDV